MRPGYFGGNYLGKEYDPFETGGDPNAKTFTVQNLGQAADARLAAIAESPHAARASSTSLRREIDASGALEVVRSSSKRDAYELVTGERAIEAFDI